MTGTIYINEEHLGEADENDALQMVALMQGRGWDVSYGTDFAMGRWFVDEFGEPDDDEQARFDRDWDECLAQISAMFE